METDLINLVDELERHGSLAVESYEELVEGVTPAVARHAARKADACNPRRCTSMHDSISSRAGGNCMLTTGCMC